MGLRKQRNKAIEKELEVRLLKAELIEKQLSYALDQYEMYENRRVVDEDKGWIIHGRDVTSRGELTEEDVDTIQEQAYVLFKTNPHARALIRGLEKFVIGRGANVDPRDNRPEVKMVWDRFKKANGWKLRQKEIVRRALRDGEAFVYEKTDLQYDDNKGTIKLRFIEPFEITSGSDGTPSYGIATSKRDIEDVKYYNRFKGDESLQRPFERIPAEKMVHIKLNADSNEKRGIPVMEPVMKYIVKYEQWLEDRIVLNKIRTAIALVKRYDATPEQIAALRDEHQSATFSNVGMDKRQKMPEGGSVIHTNLATEYEFLSPKLDASDATTDGRAILLTIAAGAGMPEYIITADSSNSNYSSTLIAESPGVREVEDYQSTFEFHFKEIYRRVMQFAIDTGEIKELVEDGIVLTTKAEFNFPSLVYRDFWREAQAFEIMHQNKVVSRKTWQERVDLDPDNEEQNFELEGDPFMAVANRPDRTSPNMGDDEPPKA